MKPENPTQFQRPVTVADQEEWRRQDAESSLDSAIEQLKDQSRQNGKGMTAAFLKAGIGAPLQGVIALVPQRDQKALQPVIAVTQMASGIISAFSSMVEGQRLDDKLAEKIAKLEKTRDGLSSPSDQKPSEGPSLKTAERNPFSEGPAG